MRTRTLLLGLALVGCAGGESVDGTLLVHRSAPGQPPVLCEVPAGGGTPVCESTPGRFAGPIRPGAPAVAVIEVRDGPDGHLERLVRWSGLDQEVTELLGWTTQVRDPVWGPDGSLLVTHHVDGVSVLSRILPDGTRRVLQDDPAGSFEPVWAADGTRVVFAASRDGNAELYTLAPHADPSRPTLALAERLTRDPADDLRPRLSRQGQLAFLSDRGDTRQVWTLHTGGARPVQTRPGDTHVDLAFSPSGGTLAVVGGPSPDQVGVTLIDVTTGEARARIGDQGLTAEQPAWSADGSLLAVTCRRAPAPPGVCVVSSSDGRVLVEITDPGAELWLPRWR